MTFQPPPPPSGGTPPPPPPGGQYGPPPSGGQYGPPPSGGQFGAPGNQPVRGGSFDPKTVNPLDWGIVGAGVLAFIFSFINFFTYSGKGALSSYSVDQSAWSGFVTLLAILLVLVGVALVAIELFAPQVKLPVPTRLAALGAFALATLLMIIALFFVPDYGGGGPGYDASVDEGHGFGYWACLILIIAATVLSLMRLQQTGGQLPGAFAGLPNIGGHGGTASRSGTGATGGPTPPPPGYGQQPPPPPGYGPPQ